jgi:hypothetical protein
VGVAVTSEEATLVAAPMTRSPAAAAFAGGDWPEQFEAVLRCSDVEAMRVNGRVHCSWSGHKELQARCEAAGMTNLQLDFDADCGYTLYLPGRNDWEGRPDLIALVERALASGHRLDVGQTIGLRSAYRCNHCDGRLYMDAGRELVCGELTGSERCPARPERRAWGWLRRITHS